MMNSTITVAVATHKPYRMPSDAVYLPLHVGATINPDVCTDMQPDDTGENISEKNAWYSELTGLYWMWKNNEADYKGLVHYRRHFATDDKAKRSDDDPFNRIATEMDYRRALKKAPVVLPKARNYYIETIESHYRHTMPGEQVDAVRQLITDVQPSYSKDLERQLSGTHAHLFNMFVMRSDIMDGYCSWLFPLLRELTQRLDPAQYDSFGARYPGRVSEWLLDVWLRSNGIPFTEVVTTSPEPVNWVRKGSAFLAAKFLGRKYEKSF